MKLSVELNNKAKKPVSKALLISVIKKAIQESNLAFLAKKNLSVSAAVVSKNEIRNINKIYRRKDSPTDVLSFSQYENIASLKKVRENDILLGELVICYGDIKDWAKNQNLGLRNEIEKVAAHGTLHLLGFIHGKKMFKIQEKIIKKLQKNGRRRKQKR